jgi:hypothetical protein
LSALASQEHTALSRKFNTIFSSIKKEISWEFLLS